MEAANALVSSPTTTTPKSGAERRRYPRLVFSPKDGVTAGLCFATPEGANFPIQSMVMNISQGGLGMGVPRDEMGGVTLDAGDRLTITELRIVYRQVRLTLGVTARIRWTVAADHIDHICFGCAFNAHEDRLRQQLTGFVEYNFPHLALA